MFFSVDPASRHHLPWHKTMLCAVCIVILIVNGISLSHNLDSLKGANALIKRTLYVTDRLQHLNLLLTDAESSIRAYFISGADAYLGPSKMLAAEADSEFSELQSLLFDSPSQLKNLAHLRTLVQRKIAILRQAVDVYKHGGLADIVKIEKISDERAFMDEIRLLVVIMVQEQNETLHARSAIFYSQYKNAVLVGIGINAVAILVLIMFYQLVRRSFMNRAAVEHALQTVNENLESTVANRTEQLSVLSRHLISVSEEEKARLSRELHDEMGANLTAISMDLSIVIQNLLHSKPELALQLQRAKATLLDTVHLKRRIIENLRPSLLDNMGLNAAIESYCEEFSRVNTVLCEVDIEVDIDRTESSLAIALFRIVQESLTNIKKYARAGKVRVSLKQEVNKLALRISDDGIGITNDTAVKPLSHGLLGMRERALLLGGTFAIRSDANAAGTCVEVIIPMPAFACVLNGTVAPGAPSFRV